MKMDSRRWFRREGDDGFLLFIVGIYFWALLFCMVYVLGHLGIRVSIEGVGCSFLFSNTLGKVLYERLRNINASHDVMILSRVCY